MPQLDKDQYLKKAKALVARNYNESFPISSQYPAHSDDFYVVWFAKVLGNWKALVSTDIRSGQYWEVTYDGNKNQTYVDHYTKLSSTTYEDDMVPIYASAPNA
jgi:hypothetical protein